MTRSRILVTGGSGYLGRWIAELARPKWDVAATYATRPAQLERVAWHQLDVRDADQVRRLIDDLDPRVIVHTAALNPGQGNDFVGVNVTGTANVAAAARAAGARLDPHLYRHGLRRPAWRLPGRGHTQPVE